MIVCMTGAQLCGALTLTSIAAGDCDNHQHHHDPHACKRGPNAPLSGMARISVVQAFGNGVRFCGASIIIVVITIITTVTVTITISINILAACFFELARRIHKQ